MDPNLIGLGAVGVTTILSIIGGLCSCLLPVAILGAVAYFIINRSKQRQAVQQDSATWLNVKGRVLKSRVQVSGGDHVSVYPFIEYEYSVGGQSYIGRDVRPGDSLMKRYGQTESYDIVEKYPAESDVTVYYDPDDPSRSCLERTMF